METEAGKKEVKGKAGSKKDHPGSGHGYRKTLRNLGRDRHRDMSQGPKLIQMS